MKVRKHKEKENVILNLTKQEAWDLMMVCHSATVYNKQECEKHKKNPELWNHHRDMMDKANYFDRLLGIVRVTSETEAVEVD